MLLPTITGDTITFNYRCDNTCTAGGACTPVLDPDFHNYPQAKYVGAGAGPAGMTTTIRPTDTITNLTVYVRCKCGGTGGTGGTEEGGEDHYTIPEYYPDSDSLLVDLLTLGIAVIIRVLKKELFGKSSKASSNRAAITLAASFQRHIDAGAISAGEGQELLTSLRSGGTPAE